MYVQMVNGVMGANPPAFRFLSMRAHAAIGHRIWNRFPKNLGSPS